MKKIYFEALKLEAELGDNQHYHDLGFFVTDKDTTEKMRGIVGLPAEDAHWDASRGGFCLSLSLPEKQHVFITYESSSEKSLWMTRGHEETHALHRLGRLDPLLAKLTELGVEIQPAHISPEVLANLGGIYAMLIRGSHIRIYNPAECEPEILEAERIFREGVCRTGKGQRKDF